MWELNISDYVTTKENAVVKYSAFQESPEAENADWEIQELAFIAVNKLTLLSLAVERESFRIIFKSRMIFFSIFIFQRGKDYKYFTDHLQRGNTMSTNINYCC